MLSQHNGLVSLVPHVGSGSLVIVAYYAKVQRVLVAHHKNGKSVQMSSNLPSLTLAYQLARIMVYSVLQLHLPHLDQ